MMKFFTRLLGNGQPTIAKRELYLFQTGNVQRAYTNGDAFIEHEGVVYEPHVIKRGSHKSGRDMEKQTMEVEFSLLSEFAQNLSRSELEETTTVQMFSFEGSSFRQFWSGRLTKVKPHNDGIKLQFETEFTKIGRNAVTRKIQATCPYRLFDSDCRLNKADYAVKTTIKSVDRLNLVLRDLESFAENYFLIGMIEDQNGVLITIESSSGNNIVLKRRYDSFANIALDDTQYTTLMSDIASKTETRDLAQQALDAALPEDENYQTLLNDLAVAEAELLSAQDAVPYVTIYPGCLKTPEACKAFSNMPNYGGFPFLPSDNPLVRQVV
ncbi:MULTISPECIES: phage BR0599 family protein [unclassified Acinetobacter]|uniref:baseplate hub domain-containing protein n=1 Tax=unclassified Acinetobacter TaxID=196816 RepID=UPI0015D369CA|nr:MULTISPECIES: phage BR0599 family protein [unclassified Acinetobacter]